jgi:hypothetical protein
VRFLDAAGKVAASGSQEFPMHGLMSDAKNVLAKPVRFSACSISCLAAIV